MNKGKFIIGVGAIVWAIVLVFIAFFSTNPYLNEILFFFGAMVAVAFFACGCEEIEKAKKVNN